MKCTESRRRSEISCNRPIHSNPTGLMMGNRIRTYGRRVTVAAMIGLCAVLINAALGNSRSAYSASMYGDLHGTVSVCERDFGKCIHVNTTVTVFLIKDHRSRGPVEHQRAKGGRFSFRLTPGTYLPTAHLVEAQLNDGRCVSGEARVRANTDINDPIICYAGVRVK
jgi:hypothetical protein